MSTRIAINGFGRIGRSVLRALTESGRTDLQVVAINDLAPVDANARLLKYDSVHGRYPHAVRVDGNTIDAGTGPIAVSAQRDPAALPWGALGVDIVLECTGLFTARDKAAAHLTAGAKRVLVSAPADGVDLTVVYGVNHAALKAEHTIVSNASCTTNCLAPLAKVLHEAIGIERGFMLTVHAYTNDQQVLDQYHKDPYRARAAAVNMIPTSTGAAKAVGLVLPELAGKLDGAAVRVPVPNVSLIDLSFIAARDTSVDEINALFQAAAAGSMAGVLSVVTEPLVSSDFNHDPASSSVALDQTRVSGGRMVRVASWYDNEWGFSNRMCDVAALMGRLLRGAA